MAPIKYVQKEISLYNGPLDLSDVSTIDHGSMCYSNANSALFKTHFSSPGDQNHTQGLNNIQIFLLLRYVFGLHLSY